MQFFTQVKENYRQAIAVSNVTDFWTNQVCRRIAAVIVIIINPTMVSPNTLTGISFLLNLFGNFQLFSGELKWAAFFFLSSFIMDCADGQLARFQDNVTKFGIYLDIVSDSLKELITFAVLIEYFSNSIYFNYSLIAFVIVSFSIILDWVRKTINNQIKKTVIKEPVFKAKYGIIFWSGPIRNFLIVLCLTLEFPEGIIFYSCFPGIYFTIKKGLKIFNFLKKG